jgi:uncharacterized protein YcsI (UPF0317 family)
VDRLGPKGSKFLIPFVAVELEGIDQSLTFAFVKPAERNLKPCGIDPVLDVADRLDVLGSDPQIVENFA